MKTSHSIINTIADALDVSGSDHNMRRDRAYTGQPNTDTGIRGRTPIEGVTFRDLHDCFIRAYVLSHKYYKDGTIEGVQPNATLHDEADKGENAVLCENDLYTLVGDIDPMALLQNLSCEVEKLMGIYPNVAHLWSEV